MARLEGALSSMAMWNTFSPTGPLAYTLDPGKSLVITWWVGEWEGGEGRGGEGGGGGREGGKVGGWLGGEGGGEEMLHVFHRNTSWDMLSGEGGTTGRDLRPECIRRDGGICGWV